MIASGMRVDQSMLLRAVLDTMKLAVGQRLA
jgi:hypothetical protein